MQLSFRGIHYESKPLTMEYTEGEVGGKYRGKPWKVHRPKGNTPHHSRHQLTYRGVHYTH
jgi:hypothetical protein